MQASSLTIFETCYEIEKTMAEVYFRFHELYKDDTQIADLWYKTSLEEENHAMQFKLAISMRSELTGEVEVDLVHARQALQRVRDLARQVAAAPPTPVEALSIAVEMERRLAEFHVDCLARFKESSHQEMFRAMMKADREHVETLEQALLACEGSAGLRSCSAS